MMDTDEIYEYMEQYLGEEALQRAFQNIQRISDSCENYSLKKPLRIPELLWRDFNDYTEDEFDFYSSKMPYLKYFKDSLYRSDRYLVKAIIDGIKSHKDLQNDAAYKELEDNLERTWISSEVNKARWSAYYLNLQRNIDECWNAGTIVGPARGSGGGFLLLYCLDIIQMNKLRENTTMMPWRFLNPERVSILDIDTDIEGSKRPQVIKHLKQVYGEENVVNVSTFRTEKPKASILTAARGLGIDVDIAQEIASLIPVDRGIPRTLHQCMYGDEEKGYQPIKQFVFEMTENYPKLWEVAKRIEGLICGSGVHAGGIIFTDEPFVKITSLKRAPDGTLCTAFDLHDSEAQSLIKIDLLSIEAMDKIHICIDLLCEQGYIEKKDSLRETYESVVGIYNIERTEPKMWDMVKNHKINSLFQFEKMSGINGINLTNPRSVEEMAVLNSIIRLMASEKGAEQPLDTWARYRRNIEEWHNEMRSYGLSKEDIEWLSNYPGINNGICESQEGLMMLVQEERLGGNSLTFADKCRKGIAKKQGKLFEECEKEYFENAKEKGCNDKLVSYVWNVLFKVQRGYSFNLSHTYSYSLIALQEMNLAYKYPIIFWNCACLIADSGGTETEDEEEYEVEIDREESYTNCIENFVNEDNNEEEEEDDEEENNDESVKKKKKTKTTNFGKIATAIGKMKSIGIEVAPPNINKSGYTFSPEVESNTIRYGLSGITRVGEDVIQNILLNRPYDSISDFLGKVKLSKPQMVNLIKSGAFDDFGNSREEIMENYIRSVSDQKKRVTLQNMKMLIDFNLIPEELDFEKRVFNFNKHLKKFKSGTNYLLDDVAMAFFDKYFDVDNLIPVNEEGAQSAIKQTVWDKIYTKKMDKVRAFIKSHYDELLTAMNNRLIKDLWNKYCSGSISKWEMDSVSYYSKHHELEEINNNKYYISDFFIMPENPEIESIINIRGKQVPILKINRIAGTVLDRNKNKKLITLLTTTGVVTVRLYGDIFSYYDKQISEKDLNTGKKKVIEKSWFSRGNKIIVTGVRRGEEFLAKKYAKTLYPLVELIEEIKEDGSIISKKKRYGDE